MWDRGVGKALFLLVAVLSLALLLPTAMADSKARIVRLSYVSGDVQFDRGEGQGYDRAIMNMPVTQGARVWTRGSDALAEIEFEDGSAIRLTPDSIAEFQELGLRDSGERLTSVDLRQGTAYIDVRGHAGDFRVASAGQEIAVPHDSRFRLDASQGQLKVAVYKGDVKVRGSGHEVKVKKDETFTLDLTDPSRYFLAQGSSEGQYDAWNQERDQYRNTYASNTYNSAVGYNGYSQSYMYGLSDLNYYGNYSYAPGYGWVWQPYGMGFGWNPFMDGAWMWYPGFGYMWVSSYPWGWMPYRYGSWNFVPGHGWCWLPGRTWTRWVPYTPVRNLPTTGFVQPRPPATPPPPGGHGIIIVGNGGRTVSPRTPWEPRTGPRAIPRREVNVTPLPHSPAPASTTTAPAPAPSSSVMTGPAATQPSAPATAPNGATTVKPAPSSPRAPGSRPTGGRPANPKMERGDDAPAPARPSVAPSPTPAPRSSARPDPPATPARSSVAPSAPAPARPSVAPSPAPAPRPSAPPASARPAAPSMSGGMGARVALGEGGRFGTAAQADNAGHASSPGRR